jgi:hypothetical protein
MERKVIAYKGIEIEQNPLNHGWMIFFKDHSAPYVGNLRNMKRIIDEAIITGEVKEFLQSKQEAEVVPLGFEGTPFWGVLNDLDG